MISFKPLIDPSFWFQLDPNYLSPVFEKGFFALFALMIVLGAIVRIMARKKGTDRFSKDVKMRWGVMLMTMGFLGLVWFFFTYEGVPFFGARFWFLIWLAGVAAWKIFLFRYMKHEVPSMKERAQSHADANKYLPRKKRK